MYTKLLWAAYVFYFLATSLGLAATVLPAEAEAKLPPCCRRDGKHRCGMREAAATPAGSGATSLKAGRCDAYPTGTAAPAGLPFALLPTVTTLPLPEIRQAAIGRAPLVRPAASGLAGSVRGPPAHSF